MINTSYTQKLNITGAQAPVAFAVPAGTRISAIVSEKLGTTAGNLTIGTSCTSPVKEVVLVDKITAATGAGDVTVTLIGDDAVKITLEGEETAAEVAAVIAAGTYKSYVATVVEGEDTVGVKFTAKETGTKTGTHTIAFADTGVTSDTLAVTVTGAPYVVATDVVNTVALSTKHRATQDLTLLKKAFSVSSPTNLFVDINATGCTADLHFILEKFL
jgi:hypothetical protein